MQNFLSLVSSRGLLKSCSLHSESPKSTSSSVGFTNITDLVENGSIYICTDALESFIRDLLPQIRVKFTLCSGDSDRPIDSALINSLPISGLLNSPYLVNWFAQNLLCQHPKIHHLPIGFDFHTCWDLPGNYEIDKISPPIQEQQILKIFRESAPFIERKILGYCDWLFTAKRGDRQECISKIAVDACVRETARIPRHLCWVNQSQYAFVISPQGVGADCHRTWEAIALGCVPVIKKSDLTPLFDKLPVWIVNDWDQVTLENMQSQHEIFAQAQYDFSALFLSYWQRKISGYKAQRLPLMNLVQFREFLVGPWSDKVGRLGSKRPTHSSSVPS